jgi:hypothetical protein
MNHIKLYASSAIQTWLRFTQYLTSNLKVVAFTLLTSNLRNAVLTSTFRLVFDRAGTLQARALKGLTPSRLRVARGVAFAIGISLSIPMASADSGSIDAITPKQYIRLSMDKKEAICLMKLYGKESAFNPKAIGNLSGTIQTYGIPQLKNPIIKDKNPIDQVRYGIKYIDHRYDGDTCKAWEHWIEKGWH